MKELSRHYSLFLVEATPLETSRELEERGGSRPSILTFSIQK